MCRTLHACVELQVEVRIDGDCHGDDTNDESEGIAPETSQLDLFLIIRELELLGESDGKLWVESEIAVKTCLKLLDGGIRNDTRPLDTGVEGEEVVQVKLYWNFTGDVDGVALALAQLEFLVELEFAVDGQDARMNRGAGVLQQLLWGGVLVLTALSARVALAEGWSPGRS